MTLALSIILLSLLSTVINSQLQNCQIVQNTGCRISSTDLTTHALVQTLSPIQCMPAPSMDSFTLKSFRVEFNIITQPGDQSMDIRLVIFFPTSSTGNPLQSFDNLAAQNNILYDNDFFITNVNAGLFSYQFTSISFTFIPCPGDIAIMINTKRVGDGITSIKMSECLGGNKIAASSTLSYYDKSMEIQGNTLGIIGSASSSSIDTYTLKLDPLSAEPLAGICDMTNPGGGVCDCNPNCPLICIDECIGDPNIYISDIGDQWIQFINKPMDCNEISPNSVTVYLVNLNGPAIGFQMKFKMRLMSINDVVDELNELNTNGALEVQPPNYSSIVYISEGDFNTQTVIDKGYYEMKFEFYLNEPIHGNDCSNAMNCKYFWELTLEENDGQLNGIGIDIIGCDGITYDKTIQHFMQIYESRDSYYDAASLTTYNQFDLSYRLDGNCDGGQNGGQFDYCMASQWNYISVIIEPTPATQITAFKWQQQQQNMEAQCGWAFFDTIQNYKPTSNYCYDYWMPTQDCGCIELEYLMMITGPNGQYVASFEMQFRINSEFMALTGNDFDIDNAKSNFINNLWQGLSDNYGPNSGNGNNWFIPTVTFNIIQFAMNHMCSAVTNHFVTIVIEHDDESQSEWNTYEEDIKYDCVQAFLSIFFTQDKHFCYDPYISGNDCQCVFVDSFEITFDHSTEITIIIELNDDVYTLTQDVEWDQTKAKQMMTQILNQYFATYQSHWFTSTEPLEIVSFTFEADSDIDDLCPETADDKQVKMEFEILTQIEFMQWFNNIIIITEVCESSFITVMTALLGEIMDSRCFGMLVGIDDLAPSNDNDGNRRILLANDPDVGVKIEITITVKSDVYDLTFNNKNIFEQDVFGNDFMQQFDTILKTMNTNGEIDWYTDDNVEYKFDEMEFEDEINPNPQGETLKFINFKEDSMQIGISAVLLIALTIGLFGYLNSMCRGADNFRYSAVFFFGLYTWDFFSDVFFSALLYTSKLQDSNNIIYWLMFGLSVLFIVLPVLLNFKSLLSFQRKWQEDALHADRYRAWLSQYANILFFLSFLSGSTFGAIALVNSNFLGWRLFAMGLSEKDMRKFNQKRLTNVVLGENLPQLLVQIVYTGVSSQFELVAFLAICSSSISIAAAVYSFYSTRGFLADSRVQHSLFSIKVTCNQTEFLKHPGHYKNKTYILATEIARIFPLDRSCVEILPTEKFSDKHHEGLMLYFFINTSKKQPNEIHVDLNDAMKIEKGKLVSHLGKQIAKAWGLQYGEQCNKEQQIELYELKWVNQEFMDIKVNDVITSGKNIEIGKINSRTNLTTNTNDIAPGETDNKLPLAVAHTSQNSSHPTDFETIDVENIKDDDDNKNNNNDEGDVENIKNDNNNNNNENNNNDAG
eukprot:544204_1